LDESQATIEHCVVYAAIKVQASIDTQLQTIFATGYHWQMPQPECQYQNSRSCIQPARL